MAGPLEGLRIIDLTRGVAGPYATKLIADYGADVVKLEPPGGDPARRFGPFVNDEPHGERSGLFLHLNTNKRSMIVDPSSDDGAQTIRTLTADADMLIEDYAPGEPQMWGWGWNTLSELNGSLVMASITPYGQSGPYRDYRASELTLQAMSGPLCANGHQDREPLKLAGHYAQSHAGCVAALATLIALRRAEGSGQGDWIDIALHECQAGCRDRQTVFLTMASYSGMPVGRLGSAPRRIGAGVRPCVDGYVNIMGAANRLPRLLRMIGREDVLEHPEFSTTGQIPEELQADLEASYAAWLERKPKGEAMAEAQAHGLLAGAVNTIADVLADPQYRARGAWDSIEHPEAGTFEYPGRPFVMERSPRPTPRRAPLLDEHGSQMKTEMKNAAKARAGTRTPSSPVPALPLEGLRIAEITVVWAGPHVTQLLAEWGADVVRVEPMNKIQPYSRGVETLPSRARIKELAARGVPLRLAGNDPGDDPWNRNAAFNSHARNKRSMACDIMSPEGREAFLRLIEHCDVLVENNVPETIDKANLGWEELRRINPRLIMLRMPAFALEGPYRNYRAFGLHVEAMIGHTHLRGYPGESPEMLSESLASDGISGVQGAVAVMMALRHRERTGEGQLIELPLTEGFFPILGEFVMDYTMNGRDTPTQGNRHPWNAPHNVYPCTGDDSWIAIDVGSDEEFTSLCTVMDANRLTADARFATAPARRENVEALDSELSALTRAHDKEALFEALQRAEVCAAPVSNAVEVLDYPQLEARGFFEELET
ncbi:MAG: CoA transferase, partial [Pseudomonadales bacterium]